MLFHFSSYNTYLLLLLFHHSLFSSVQQFLQFPIVPKLPPMQTVCLVYVIFPLTSNCKCYLFQLDLYGLALPYRLRSSSCSTIYYILILPFTLLFVTVSVTYVY